MVAPERHCRLNALCSRYFAISGSMVEREDSKREHALSQEIQRHSNTYSAWPKCASSQWMWTKSKLIHSPLNEMFCVSGKANYGKRRKTRFCSRSEPTGSSTHLRLLGAGRANLTISWTSAFFFHAHLLAETSPADSEHSLPDRHLLHKQELCQRENERYVIICNDNW